MLAVSVVCSRSEKIVQPNDEVCKQNVHEPTVIFEAVASNDLWIWHSFFGLSGFFDDINILDQLIYFKIGQKVVDLM